MGDIKINIFMQRGVLHKDGARRGRR